MEKSNWKVEIRTTCKVCGEPLPNARYRTYCSANCRNKRNNDKQTSSGYSKKFQQDARNRIASIPSKDKCQCLICGKWYVQLGSHVYQVHDMSARAYREHFELEVKRGITPDWYRKLKSDQAMDNETYKNLEKGAKFRYEKGDKSAGKYTHSPITLERLRNKHKN